jgi:hypothetical protein
MEKKTLVKYGIREAYKYYKLYTENPVSYKQFRLIWTTFIDKVTTGIVESGRDFSMPYRLGAVGIRKRKIVVKLNPDGTIDKRSLRPDWDATKQLWAKDPEAMKQKTLVFHLNKHFGGYNAKWFWDKSTCIVKNQTAYSLMLSRNNKRKLSVAIFDEDLEVDYYEQKPKSHE